MLGYDIDAALPELRRQAESMMVDTCTVEYVNPDAEPGWDEGSGTSVPTYASRYTGKCRVQTTLTEPSNPDAGEREWTVESFTVSVPMSAVGFEVGDRVTITTSAFDADLVGGVFTVTGLAHKTHMTARRLRVQEVAG
jgi:hypothetical protein